MSSSDKVDTGEDYYKNFLPKKWSDKTAKQLASLDALEKHMANKHGRKKKREVKNATLDEGEGSFYYGNPDVLKIDLNRLGEEYGKSNDEKNYMSGYFAMATGIHEGIHAGQYDAINNDKKLKDNYDKTTLGVMGQDLFYKGVGYIVRPTESDAHSKTFAELLKVRKKIAKEYPEELKKYDEFLKVYNKQNEDKIRDALEQLEAKDLNQAEQKIAERIDNYYKHMKGQAEIRIGEIKRIEGERKKLFVELNEFKAERKKMGIFKNKKELKEKIKLIEEKIAGKNTGIVDEINQFKTQFSGDDSLYPYSPKEVLRQMKGLEHGEGLVAKEKGDGITVSHSAKSPNENKIPEFPQSSQPPPDPTEREKNKQAHLNEIKWLQKELAFLEKFHKTTNHEPSRQSLENTIEVLKGLQEKLTQSIYVKHGVTPDKLTEYRELAASHGYEAIRQFEHTGQYDAGFLADAANRAINVTSKSSQTPTQTEQAAIVANLIELKNKEKAITLQLINSKKSLTPDAIEALKEARAKAKQDYKNKFAEAKKRPDKKQIMKLWIEAKKQEVKIAQAAKGKEHTFSQTK